MILLNLLWKNYRLSSILASLLAISGGITGILCLHLLTHLENEKKISIIIFISTLLFHFLSKTFSQQLLLKVGQDAVLEFRVRLSQQVIKSPLLNVEERGSVILANLTEDIDQLGITLSLIPILIAESVTIFCTLVYIFYLAWHSALLFLLVIGLGVFIYYRIANYASHYLEKARVDTDYIYKAFNDLIVGGKELRLNSQFRQYFYKNEIEFRAQTQRSNRTRGLTIYAWNSGIGEILLWLACASLTLEVSDIQSKSWILMAGIFLLSPLSTLINGVSQLTRGRIALRQIMKLGLDLQKKISPEKAANSIIKPTKLELKELYFTYSDEFKLGPIDITLQSGEITFLVGGNGSGKSTLLKVLSGLYPMHAGQILINGDSVQYENAHQLRELFGGVFFDFHLFELLPGDITTEELHQFLVTFELDRKVYLEPGNRFSTTALSSGQKRRLALIRTLVEDKPIFIFDEWAADQDPKFKNYFYTTLLPWLKSKGKILIVVSHDVSYFNCADQLIYLDSGCLKTERLVK